MPVIDLQCHFGAVAGALAVRPPDIDAASGYANDIDAQRLCFSSDEAATDLDGGNTRLGEALKTDARFRGWLTLSVHQPTLSQTLARKYLTKSAWVGARFESRSDADTIDAAGGHVVLNALRRYGRPVLLAVWTPAALHAVLGAAREFHTLKFIVAPQTEELTSDSIPAIKELINISWLPSAAYAERDVLAQAVEAIGERRVLWGSDWGKLHPAAALGLLGESAVSGAQRERIAFRNAHDLLAHE
ncbi:MAG TPA: amidohydrolase family protein [Abditibacteriaceae bacterium]|jgi:hypothetical protein